VLRIIGGGRFIVELSAALILSVCFHRSLFFFSFFVRNVCRNRGYTLDMMNLLDDALFKRMFRIDRSTFDCILCKIELMLSKNEAKTMNSSGEPISVCTRLAVALRWLAGGSYLDICFAWGLGISTFCDTDHGVLWPTLQAINDVFSMGFPIDDEEKLEELSRGFSEHSSGILDGCVLALDGLGVCTRCPFKTEVSRPKDYRFRKSGFAILVLAGCDIKAHFVCASCDHSGSTNDIIAWQDSHLYQMLEMDKLLPTKYFFIGDEAFNTTEQFLSPWPGKCVCSEV